MTARRAGWTITSFGVLGSGNVFADLGFVDPETELTKAKVLVEIDGAIKKRGLAHARAAQIMRMPVKGLAKLLDGQTQTYTVERLKELRGRLLR